MYNNKFRMLLFNFPLLFFIIMIKNITNEDNYRHKDLSILIEQIKNHPKQTLQDVYKSCYQDEYGPGHLITNESSTINYILEEINSIGTYYNPPVYFEYAGLEGNYIRVDLSLVKNKTIPFFVMFKALTISAAIGQQKTDEGWPKIWSGIVEEIRQSTLKFDNFEEDAKRLDEISKSKDKVVHHSELYENTYNPHYRIIEKNVFEKYIKPFI